MKLATDDYCLCILRVFFEVGDHQSVVSIVVSARDLCFVFHFSLQRLQAANDFASLPEDSVHILLRRVKFILDYDKSFSKNSVLSLELDVDQNIDAIWDAFQED